MIQQAINQALNLSAIAGRLDPNFELKQKREEVIRKHKAKQETQKLENLNEQAESLDPTNPREYMQLTTSYRNLARDIFKKDPTEANYQESLYAQDEMEAARRSMSNRQRRKLDQRNTLVERMNLLRGEEYDYETGGIE